ncbi:GNAT family N-acetyltransferase [Haloterrigena sp. H1]|uniref:GNAT family N-acetyltransferase n=1 Tax=Haloterrigena sp. H1 TaxID=2552943 RepID=UPI00110E4F07|nr:GNAT family N-acetyltransferase [Haloterrigena sp. H1]TMT77640.1 GNAT family N-acetyltransferase [Haloterrigena sp. H1]TMT87810.1 GNAT family N-acetyltransferase [Haloterrigena sp. H1]
MEIREPESAETERIREVVDSSMTTSFRLSPAQIDGLVDEQFADEAVVDKREDEETLLQVAETGAEIEGTTIAGFVEGRLEDGWGEVRWLFVDPEHRGKDIGTELYETATETLRDRGAEHICVTVLEANTEGHDFVERLGLEHDGDRRVEIADESVVNYVYTEPDVDATLPGSAGEDAADEEFPETERVDEQLTTADDGTTVYIARDEEESGTAASFFVTYEDDAHTEQYGFYCANCGSLAVSMNNMDRLECSDCGNTHTERSTESYDDSYL